jgi:hypothetical protein
MILGSYPLEFQLSKDLDWEDADPADEESFRHEEGERDEVPDWDEENEDVY